METTIFTSRISSGEFDAQLPEIFRAVESRMAEIRAVKTPQDFGIGDVVRFNNQCATRYLVGHTARVVGMKRTKIVVKLEKPTGRFSRVMANGEIESASITVPISIVDPV
jgi:hypothetical protein